MKNCGQQKDPLSNVWWSSPDPHSEPEQSWLLAPSPSLQVGHGGNSIEKDYEGLCPHLIYLNNLDKMYYVKNVSFEQYKQNILVKKTVKQCPDPSDSDC